MPSALIYAVSIALVAAATTVSFGIASFSFLDTTSKMPRGFGIGDRRAELKPVLSDVIAHTLEKAVLVPAEAKVPSAAVEATLRAPAPEGPPALRTGITPTPPIAAEQREEVFREFEMKIKRDTDKRRAE